MDRPHPDRSATVTRRPMDSLPGMKEAIGRLGGGFMISRYAKAAAEEHGLTADPWSAYFIGRAGVLGDVDADVVAASVGFYPTDVVRLSWETARARVAPAAGARRYAQACQEWGRARLAGFAGAARLAELAGVVVAQAEVVGLPLFAGWRAMPLPDDAEARVVQLLHVLREHRGGTHLLAVLATGLTPRAAVLAGSGGAPNAQFFGWRPPYEDVSGLADQRAQAEALTDRLAAPAFQALDDAETDELRGLLGAAVAHAFR